MCYHYWRRYRSKNIDVTRKLAPGEQLLSNQWAPYQNPVLITSHPLTEHGVHTHIDIFRFNCGMTTVFTATSFVPPYPSLPGWWSWCRVRRSSRRCSCRASGSQTPWRCWWWGWRGRPRPVMEVCSAPQCTAPSGCLSLSPTRSPSTPKPETHIVEGLALSWIMSFGRRSCCLKPPRDDWHVSLGTEPNNKSYS